MDEKNTSFDRNQYMPPNPQATTKPASFAGAVSQSEQKPEGKTAFDPNQVSVNDSLSGSDKKPPAKMALILGLVVIALVGLAIFALARKNPSASANGKTGTSQISGAPERVIPTIDVTQPSLSFASAATTFSVGKEVTVSIKANSLGADVNGYDLLFPYDKEAFEIVDAKSALDTFQIYQFDRGEYYSITGIKLLNVKTATPFADQSIIELKIKPKKAGRLYIEVMAERGKETSKFVDKDVKIIKPQFQPIKLEIQ